MRRNGGEEMGAYIRRVKVAEPIDQDMPDVLWVAGEVNPLGEDARGVGVAVAFEEGGDIAQRGFIEQVFGRRVDFDQTQDVPGAFSLWGGEQLWAFTSWDRVLRVR